MSVGDDLVRGAPLGPVGAIFSAAIGGLTGKREGDPGGIFGRAIATQAIVRGEEKRFTGTISADDARALAAGTVTSDELRIKYGQTTAAPPAPPAPPPPAGDIGNAPRPADNAPIPMPGVFVPGSIFWGSKGPRKRPRVKRKRRRFPNIPVMSDQESFDYFPGDAFVGNPDVWGPPITAPAVGRAVLTRVLTGVGGVLGWILYPNRTADDDIIVEPMPQPIPKGPPSRPRVGRPWPYAWPLPDFQGKWRKRPRVPGVLYPDTSPGDLPRTAPRRAPQPRQIPSPWPSPPMQPQPSPAPTPSRRSVPGPRTMPRPGTMPAPRRVPFPSLPSLLPYALPFLFPSPSPRVSRPAQPRIEPPGVQQPLPIDLPLTQPYSYRANYCPPCESDRKRKRKKDSCTNPISGKRTFTRGGVRFRTITRRLQCPV